MSRKRIRLVHWNAAEAKQRVAKLRDAGYVVNYGDVTQDTFKELRRRPPDAVIIDLSRIPSQGRDVALGLRGFKATRHVPIVFVEGDANKLAGIKKHLPDAEYTNWPAVRSTLKRAIANPPATPHFIVRADGSFTDLVTGVDSPAQLIEQIQAAG